MTMSSRGPDAPGLGPERAERAAAAFWREVHAVRPALSKLPGGDALRAALSSWIGADASSAALVLTAGERETSHLLASWALEISEAGEWDVTFVPVHRRMGTALERNALGLAFARLCPHDPVHLPWPYGPRALREALAERLATPRKVDEDGRKILLVVDGLDEACDWATSTKDFFVRTLAPHVRVVFSARSDQGLAGIAILDRAARIVYAPTPAGAFATLPDRPQAIQALLRAIACGPESAVVLGVLARALGPIAVPEIAAAAGLAPAVVDEALRRMTPPVAGPLADRSGVSLISEAYRDGIDHTMSVMQRAAIDSRLGRLEAAIASDVSLRRDEQTDYACDYRGAHLRRDRSSLAGYVSLVSPEWLATWRGRADGALGFVGDVERAFAAACDAPASHDDAQRVDAIALQARCILTKTSLYNRAWDVRRAISPSSEDDDDDDVQPPIWRIGHDPVDTDLPIGDGGARARALVRLAHVLPEDDRVTIIGWAVHAAREARSASGLAAVARTRTGAEGLALAREAATALRQDGAELRQEASLDDWIETARLLPEDEAFALALEALQWAASRGRAQSFLSASRAASSLPAAVVARLWDEVRNFPDPWRYVCVARLAGGLPDSMQRACMTEALSALLALPRLAYTDDAQWAIEALAPHLTFVLSEELAAFQVKTRILFGSVVRSLSIRLADFGRMDRALELVRLAGSSFRVSAAQEAVERRGGRVARWIEPLGEFVG